MSITQNSKNFSGSFVHHNNFNANVGLNASRHQNWTFSFLASVLFHRLEISYIFFWGNIERIEKRFSFVTILTIGLRSFSGEWRFITRVSSPGFPELENWGKPGHFPSPKPRLKIVWSPRLSSLQGGRKKGAISDQYLAIARKRLKIDGYILLCVWQALNLFSSM